MELKEQLALTMQQINEVTELFYQQKEKEGYDALDRVLANIMQCVDGIFACQQQLSFDGTAFQENLVEALNAMEEKDTVLLSDVLKYDIYDKLEAVSFVLQNESE